MDSEIVLLFSSYDLRVTKPRTEVFKVLKNATKPLSQVEIAKLVDIDKVSVYRTVVLFLKLGVIIGIAHGWKQRYELAAPYRPHHHHLFCTNCGLLEEIQSEKLEQFIHMLAESQQFKVTGHTFEVTGICNKCQLNFSTA